MKRLLGMVLCFLLCGAFPAVAEDAAVTSEVVSTVDAEGWKTELNADKQAVAARKDEMKQASRTARGEERALGEQIRAAKAAGDTAKVQELRAQLKETHQQNVAEMKTDQKELQDARKGLRLDRKEALKNRADANKDGTVDAAEKARMKALQQQKLEDRKKAMKVRADKNKDGKVGRVEKVQAKEAGKKKGWWGW